MNKPAYCLKSCKNLAKARREVPPGLLSQPPEFGSLATASRNSSTYHSVFPACSLRSAPGEHKSYSPAIKAIKFFKECILHTLGCVV